MLSEAEFALVAREVKNRSGAALKPDMSALIENRLHPLSRREGYNSVPEMIAAARIRPDGALWNAIAEALAQPETRFFRDRAQFARLREHIIPEALARRGHERARIWCAGCSTGQEAYSLAMIVEDMRAEGANPAIEIIATDFAERALDKARSGLFTQFEVQRGLPIRTLIAHFERAGDLWRISDRLRAGVRFERHNLLQHPGGLGQFDIILLAHVLPTFDHETRLAVLNRIADALRPDGVLILGDGETLPEGCERLTSEHGLVRHRGAARVAA
jgi:chemotaxis protein methyltransferase CheR